MTTNVLERIVESRQTQSREAIDAYYKLVRQAEAGRDIDPAEAIQILDRAGKTDLDLARDAETVRTRRALAARLETLPALRQELAGVDASIVAADNKLDTARAEHQRTVEPLRASRNRIAGAIAAAEGAAGELFRNCDKPEIKAAESKLAAEVKKLTDEKQGLESELTAVRQGSPGWTAARRSSEIKKIEANIRLLAQQKRKATPEVESELKSLRESLAELEKATLKPMRARVDAIGKRLGELMVKQQSLDAAKLVP